MEGLSVGKIVGEEETDIKVGVKVAASVGVTFGPSEKRELAVCVLTAAQPPIIKRLKKRMVKIDANPFEST